ncbi:MAG TPA: FKBP-type peptidyl-prolyl cis-trans isomerase [Bacteroidales bacterium]|nr:FKBP-type peptidyl-prolyl cis-trans isomerase [Bacteroidales bacterium]
MKKNKNTWFLASLTLLMLLSMASCMPDEKKYEEEEQQEINKYLTDHPDYNFERTPSGLYYLELAPGTGSSPAVNDTAYIIYTGYYLDGVKFDSNVGKKNYIFPVGQDYWIIEGLDEGVSYMKPGGKSLMLLPSSLAYGSTGTYGISGYTPLLFEITLVKVVPGSPR